jgi:hypothetical protein
MLLTVSAAAQDINHDGRFDCGDADLLSGAILSQSQDTRFDLNADGTVDGGDFDWALDATGFYRGDVNFDGIVDRLDWHDMMLHWQRPVSSYCQGDFVVSGFVDNIDLELGPSINWHLGRQDINNSPPAGLSFPEQPDKLAVWRRGSVVFAETGPFEILARPVRAPDGLLATVVALRTKDPSDRIATFDQLDLRGAVHQVFMPSPFGSPTPQGMFRGGLPGIGRWDQADSQLLVNAHQVIGAGFGLVDETNDQTSPVELGRVEGLDPASGIGTLASSKPFLSRFSLTTDEQTSYVEFLQVVTPASLTDTDGVYLTIGVLGGDDEGEPWPFHGVVGLEQPLQIPFFAQPCDFNEDGFCDQEDLAQLTAAVISGIEAPHLNVDYSDPPIITESDIAAWHHQADPIPGDTDLDGDVDVVDLNNLGVYWERDSADVGVLRWMNGDFDYSSDVDAVDLNALGINWQQGVQPQGAIVPEPGSRVLAWLCLAFVVARRQRSF